MSRHRWAWVCLIGLIHRFGHLYCYSQLQLDTAELYPVRYRGQTAEYMYRYYCINCCTPLTSCDWPSPCVTGTNVIVPPHLVWLRSMQMMCSYHFGERGFSFVWSPSWQFPILGTLLIYIADVSFTNDIPSFMQLIICTGFNVFAKILS